MPNGVLVVEKAVMSAKIEPGSQADDDRKIRKKIAIISAILILFDAVDTIR